MHQRPAHPVFSSIAHSTILLLTILPDARLRDPPVREELVLFCAEALLLLFPICHRA
jgi:hypothetical protein